MNSLCYKLAISLLIASAGCESESVSGECACYDCREKYKEAKV